MTAMQERFTSKVDRSGDCWTWTAYIDRAGYGRFGIGREVMYAHRVAYKLEYGVIPEGSVIDHRCRNRACVRPAHLHAVSVKENLENLDGANAGNRSSGIRNVYLHKPSGRWYVRIGHRGESVYGGYFDTPAKADIAATALRNRLHTNNIADRKAIA